MEKELKQEMIQKVKEFLFKKIVSIQDFCKFLKVNKNTGMCVLRKFNEKNLVKFDINYDIVWWDTKF